MDEEILSTPVFMAFAETSEKRYIYLCNLETDLSRWSKKAVDYFGLPGEYMFNAAAVWEEHIHPDDRHIFREDIEAVFSGQKRYHDCDYRVKNKDGEYVMVTCQGVILKGENGRPDLFAGTLENHSIKNKIDAVTNLYNNYKFADDIYSLASEGKQFTVLEVGISNFSEVNDIYGYAYGDKLLKKVAFAFLQLLDEEQYIYRMDGVRFAFCFLDKDEAWISEFYKRLQDVIKAKTDSDKYKINLNLSGGAVLHCSNMNVNSIQTAMNYALAKSKYKDFGRLVIFNDEKYNYSKKNLQILNAIKANILNGCENFYLCYQPLMDVKEEKLVGMESLVRWKHDVYGQIPPAVFIPWIENDSCFWILGNWILTQALIDGKKILEKYPHFIVNVNVSYSQFEVDSFVDTVNDILAETGFPAENLCLELTERLEVIDLEHLIEKIKVLKAEGIKVALDDFGTGFSSLNLLTNLPVDLIKIDREFIKDITENIANQSVIKAITQCANELGIKVCLEGIENRILIDFLRQYNADSYQGYYYSKPIEMESFLQKYAADISSS